MLKRISVFCGALWLALGSFSPTTADGGRQILENFAKGAMGQFPDKWQGRNPGGEKIYHLAQEKGRRYLAADDVTGSIQIFRSVDWDLARYPRLRWRWRVRQFPSGALENAAGKNDSACGVYVVFREHIWSYPRVLKYIWSEALPLGTTFAGSGKTWIIVKGSGRGKMGQWVEGEADVAADFRRLFSEEQQNPTAIGLLTDANDTKSKAAGDYADFEAWPAVADAAPTAVPTAHSPKR